MKNLKAGTSSLSRFEVFLAAFWDGGSARVSPMVECHRKEFGDCNKTHDNFDQSSLQSSSPDEFSSPSSVRSVEGVG